MCDRCDELDAKIEHYRKLVSLVMDPLTTERAAILIAEIEDQKAALHPGQRA